MLEVSKIIIFAVLVLCTYQTSWATAQIGDGVKYEGKSYSLIGVQGALPTPNSFNMESVASSSANWRGYYVEYKVAGQKFFLQQITINAKDQKYFSIDGVQPDMTASRRCFKVHNEPDICTSDGGVYANLDKPIAFTGKLRLGRDFIENRYIHMWFQKPSAYKEVIDISFKDGVVLDVQDRSDDVEKIRGQFKESFEQAGAEEGVDSAFSLKMEPLK